MSFGYAGLEAYTQCNVLQQPVWEARKQGTAGLVQTSQQNYHNNSLSPSLIPLGQEEEGLSKIILPGVVSTSTL